MSKETKNKAKELVDNFNTKLDLTHNGEYRGRAKQCALICVDEIIKPLKVTISQLGFVKVNNSIDFLKKIAYWQEVKTEIKNHE